MESMKQGLGNDITLRRITRSLVDELSLPDGPYELVYSGVENDLVVMELYLSEDSPIKRGTAVVGGAVRLFLRIATPPVGGVMDLFVQSYIGPVEKDGEIQYTAHMGLSFSDQQSKEATE